MLLDLQGRVLPTHLSLPEVHVLLLQRDSGASEGEVDGAVGLEPAHESPLLHLRVPVHQEDLAASGLGGDP